MMRNLMWDTDLCLEKWQQAHSVFTYFRCRAETLYVFFYYFVLWFITIDHPSCLSVGLLFDEKSVDSLIFEFLSFYFL